jgi:hypothetical protein
MRVLVNAILYHSVNRTVMDMKKNTKKNRPKNAETAVVGAVPFVPKNKPVRRGPRKEKVQISVRISKAYMDLAYAHIKRTNTRITDILERGLVLAMSEENRLAPIASEVRFLVANTTREQQRVLRNALAWLAIPEVQELSPSEAFTRRLFLESTDLASSLAQYDKAIELYSRYGHFSEQPAPPELSPSR